MVARLKETGGRDAAVLENGLVRVMVDDAGGMVPELSYRKADGYLNTHWIPEFRANGGRSFDQEVDPSFWKAELLRSIAGNFPCSPNFGSAETVDGVSLPAHGWAANGLWRPEARGVDGETGAAWALSAMESPEPDFPLSYRKLDLVAPGLPVHFVSLSVENRGSADLEINLGWHNTVGAPFLQAGCRISASAERFRVAPAGTEFDATGRLAPGAEFESLAAAPLRSGGSCDLTAVPGPIGHTDFVSGPVPRGAELGWSAVVNPQLRSLYLCFFPGPAAAGEGEIALSFNDFWMQYGGRSFTPWAAYEGGTDRTFCLGTENITGCFGNGLAASRSAGTLMGAPTVVRVPAGGRRVLRYGTLAAEYADARLDEGIACVSADGGRLVLEGRPGGRPLRLDADARFALLKALESRVP